MTMSDSLERMAGASDTTLAQLSRVLLIVFTIIGTPVFGVAGWLANRAADELSAVGQNLATVNITLARLEEVRAQGATLIASLQDTGKEQARQLFDHERRIVRIEARSAALSPPFVPPPPQQAQLPLAFDPVTRRPVLPTPTGHR